MDAPVISVFALFPGMTELDFTAPLEVLSRVPGGQTVLASVSGGALDAGAGLMLGGLARLADVRECSILVVPGGYGVVRAMEDEAYLGELRRLAKGARLVTSVCTGSLLLAAAGLLHGKRAACHWAWRELLTDFGVTPDPARVVRDGSVLTGGGVTAGIDMALTAVAELVGKDVAEAIGLALEYAPAPPFDSGRPETARPEVVAIVRQRLEALGADRRAAVARAVLRLRA
jgi:transcriptional regulator GlxA family with amidase domain